MEKKKFFTKKKMVAGVAVLAVAAGGFLFFSGGKDGGIPVTVAAVEQKDLRESVSLKAPLEGTETVEIVSNLHYEITAIHVKEGDRVQKGQVLAVLDSEPWLMRLVLLKMRWLWHRLNMKIVYAVSSSSTSRLCRHCKMPRMPLIAPQRCLK